MKDSLLKVVFVFALVLLIVVPGYYFSVFPSFSEYTIEGFGQFGDFFGGVLNPLLSFSVIVLLIFSLSQQNDIIRQQNKIIEQQERSINIQSNELADSNEQLRLSRLEMKGANLIHAEKIKIQTRDVIKKDVESHCMAVLNDLEGSFESITPINASTRDSSQIVNYSLSKVCKELKEQKTTGKKPYPTEGQDCLYYHNENYELAEENIEKFQENLKYFLDAAIARIEFIDASVLLNLQTSKIEKYLEAGLVLEVISQREVDEYLTAYEEEKNKRIAGIQEYHITASIK